VQPSAFAKLLTDRTFDTYATYRYPRESNPLAETIDAGDSKSLALILKYFFPREVVLQLRDNSREVNVLENLTARESLTYFQAHGVTREQIILFQGLFELWRQDIRNFQVNRMSTPKEGNRDAIKASIEYHLTPYLSPNDFQLLRELDVIHPSSARHVIKKG